jgi:predicted enzyme related to lactoylglutathione lyase
MNLVSVRLITDDIVRLVAFYEQATEIAADWSTPDFAEIVTPSGTLAVGSARTLALFGGKIEHATGNPSTIIEFLVDDVDHCRSRLSAEIEIVNEPTTMPWGNRSLLLRDPDGNLINFFTPVTPEAIDKFDRRTGSV